jgi:hypothetical protein
MLAYIYCHCLVCYSFCVPPKIRDIICFIMTPQEWAGLVATIIGIVGSVGIVLRWILKKYVEEIMTELRPNSGSSMKDQVTRLEDKVDKLYDAILIHLEDHANK